MTTMVSAQGYLMMAGGAAESQGGWSDAPYRWVVEHAANKRIAVVSYSGGQTDWIPDYFISLGATEARNISITDRITANQPWIYDTLTSYDGVFLKGGDQSIYYERYRETKTEEALQYIYDHGGVLAGTSAGTAILSPVVFTAQVASVDPGTAQLDAYSSQNTLEDDFLMTLPGPVIYDSHFVERGRFGRLPSFMATWFKNTGEHAIGIGVDDHTALCLGPDMKGTVYGTGAVTFLFNQHLVQPYDTAVKMLRTKPMEVSQLLHGSTMDLNDTTVGGLDAYMQPPIEKEMGRYSLLVCGTDYPSDTAYEYLVRHRSIEAPILIVTGSSFSRALAIQQKLESYGALKVDIIQALWDHADDPDMQQKISEAGKFFFIGNAYTDFMRFINWTGNGARLMDAIKRPEHVSFFAGDNARFVGKTVVEKYMGYGYTSYRGEMDFLPGLGLLATTALMPNTFISSNFYENTVSGLPFALINDSLRFGFYLTGNTLAEYGVSAGNLSYFRNVAGSYPVISLLNPGTYAGIADQGPYVNSRNIAGFASMNLAFLAVSDSLILGENVPLSMVAQSPPPRIQLYPNPATHVLTIDEIPNRCSVQIYNMAGKEVFRENTQGMLLVSLEGFSAGPYLVSIRDADGQYIFHKKVMVLSQGL